MRTDTHILTNTPAAEIFAFSSKERDTETGLSYFGARYYSSDLSIWLSVDPMSDKYPSLSPYTYCADNPVKLVDPNGEEINENPYLIFDNCIGKLQIYDDNNTPDDYSDDTFISEFDAHNNVASNSNGKWEDGIYEMEDKTNCHKHNNQDDTPTGRLASSIVPQNKTFNLNYTLPDSTNYVSPIDKLRVKPFVVF